VEKGGNDMREIKNNRVWWDEEAGIGYCKAVGDLDEEAARYIKHEIERIADEHGDQSNWIIDLAQRKKTTSRARKVLAEIASLPRVSKYAIFGASTFTRTIANFIISAAGNANAQFFSSEEEAIRWTDESQK